MVESVKIFPTCFLKTVFKSNIFHHLACLVATNMIKTLKTYMVVRTLCFCYWRFLLWVRHTTHIQMDHQLCTYNIKTPCIVLCTFGLLYTKYCLTPCYGSQHHNKVIWTCKHTKINKNEWNIKIDWYIYVIYTHHMKTDLHVPSVTYQYLHCLF